MKTNLRIQRAGAAVLMFGALALSACASMNNKERGAIIGATAGATVGGVIGNNTTGSTAKGAIIGAVVGGAAGAVIGHQMDQQAKELAINIPGAKVERVGEGIQVTSTQGCCSTSTRMQFALMRDETSSSSPAVSTSIRIHSCSSSATPTARGTTRTIKTCRIAAPTRPPRTCRTRVSREREFPPMGGERTSRLRRTIPMPVGS